MIRVTTAVGTRRRRGRRDGRARVIAALSGGSPVEHRQRVADGEVGHRRPRFGRRAGDVRNQHDVLERQQVRVHDGLVLVDIERSTGDEPMLERPGERRFVDDRTTRGVDEDTPSASSWRALSCRSGAASPASADSAATRRLRWPAGDRAAAARLPARSDTRPCRVGDASCRTPAPSRRRRGQSGPARPARAACRAAPCQACDRAPSPFHSPRRSCRSASPSRRVIARIRLQVKSAHALVSTSGVLVATMPRARQAARSMLL